ncbi:hypothetical protein D3C72_2533890 [compost metagenome]
MFHSEVTWLLGSLLLPSQAMRAVSTMLKPRERAFCAKAGMPGWLSHASSSAAVTALGFFGSRFFLR